ncbi:MAG TPA: type VI secretion system tip protein TssI/VgrG, partial [Myxococcaceae bacterium]
MDKRKLSLELSLEGFDPSTFRVLKMEATEALFEGYTVQVEAETAELVELEPLLGTKAALWIRFNQDSADRPFHGVVTEASLEAIRPEVFRLHVAISARLELLKLGRNSRIFQEQSIQEIVSSVLDGSGLEDGYRWALSSKPRPRANTVQYNESDFAFVSRLLHEEGIGFAVHNGEDAEQLLFFDDSTQLEPIAGDSLLVDRDSTQLDEDVIFDLRDGQSMASDQVFLRDYDFRRPALDLSATERADGASGREVYEHPGGFQEGAVGQQRAKRLLERLRMGTRVLSGRSSCARLEPGRKFSVTGHGRVEANLDLLVTLVVHRASAERDAEGQGL